MMLSFWHMKQFIRDENPFISLYRMNYRNILLNLLTTRLFRGDALELLLLSTIICVAGIYNGAAGNEEMSRMRHLVFATR